VSFRGGNAFLAVESGGCLRLKAAERCQVLDMCIFLCFGSRFENRGTGVGCGVLGTRVQYRAGRIATFKVRSVISMEFCFPIAQVDHLEKNAGVDAFNLFDAYTDITDIKAIMVIVVTPGFIDCDMTKQVKYLVKGDEMKVNNLARDFFKKSGVPIVIVERCAEAIVKRACSEERYLTELFWMKLVCYAKLCSLNLLIGSCKCP
ncbi:hypothetical protein Dimus_022687, partial [Dionaea muscipula]